MVVGWPWLGGGTRSVAWLLRGAWWLYGMAAATQVRWPLGERVPAAVVAVVGLVRAPWCRRAGESVGDGPLDSSQTHPTV